MRELIVYRSEMPYRGHFDVKGYAFGEGEKSVCVVGAMRGNEIQQMYICSQLVRRLRHIEESGAIVAGHSIMVIPCANHIAMNVGTRFWPTDHTDINRMFPGYDQGETTQRIADGLFQAVKPYAYGIQFPSYYLQGDFLPHVRYIEVPGVDKHSGDLFGMRYVVRHTPVPFDTTLLNYNWRLWDTDAYSVYTQSTDTIDTASAHEAIRACLRFMNNVGAIDYACHPGFNSMSFDDEVLVPLHTKHGGILHRRVVPGDTVREGEVVAEVLSPLTGEVVERLQAKTSGVIFFSYSQSLVTEHTLVYSTLPRVIHESYRDGMGYGR
jgi:predicted deacylase